MVSPFNDLDELLALVARADQAIMTIYADQAIKVQLKEDSSPLTQADTASHTILVEGLARLYPHIPIISEEGNASQNNKALQSPTFWLIDPIDGTKEFIAHNGQFTVCVALIENGNPTFGIISAPALGVTYYGGPQSGSFKKTANGTTASLTVPTTKNHILLASRSHSHPKTTAYIDAHYGNYAIQQVGSQLKLPYIAEGKAEVYPRLGAAMKIWDIAAGHAILEGAGGSATRPNGEAINYRHPSLLVGDFIAKS